MAIIFDLCLAATFAISVFIGYKRGFIKSIKGIVAFTLALMMANQFSGIVADYLKDEVIMDFAKQAITERVNRLGQDSDSQKFELKNDTLSGAPLKELLSQFHIDLDDFKEFYNSEKQKAKDVTSEKVVEYIVEPIVTTISSVLGYIAVFAATVIAVLLAALVIELICKAPVLSGANKLFGFLAGAVVGIMYTWVLSTLIIKAVPYLQSMKPEMFPSDIIDRTFILKIISSFNPIGFLLHI
ncbi:MAG: CvpA family protein [Clostridia bacterium]|nr:CvpA family protein [Clostridia bacterium]